jgi:hypothetical protein
MQKNANTNGRRARTLSAKKQKNEQFRVDHLKYMGKITSRVYGCD